MPIAIVRNMSNHPNAADVCSGGSKAYAANIRVKTQSSTSCSFCWFVISIYPDLAGMSSSDEVTFRKHLIKSHGLKEPTLP